MKFFKHSLSNEELRTIAITCGGVALLISLAVWISPNTNFFIVSTPAPDQVLAAGGDNGYSGNCRDLNDPGCGNRNPAKAETWNADGITPTTGRLKGLAGGGIIAVTFRYGTTPVDVTACASLPNVVNANYAAESGYDGIYVYNLSNLAPNTTYYFCIAASGWTGSASGAVLSFKTLGLAPTVVTGNESAVTQTSATLNGTVNPNGSATNYYYRYSKSTTGSCAGLTSATAVLSAGSAQTASPRSHSISNLTANTLYYYCIVGSNAIGTSYGTILSLRTTAVPPPPTLGISATEVGTSRTVNSGATISVIKGTGVRITATFAAAAGDTLTGTAIDGPAPYKFPAPSTYNWVAASGITNAPNSPESILFSAGAPGDFTFIPSAITTQHSSSWNNWGKFVTVHVACPSGQVQSGANCVPSCSAGQQAVNGVCSPICTSNQQLVNGVCVPICPSGQHLSGLVCVPNVTSCPPGQHISGGVCVPDVTSCPAGQHISGGICVPDTTPCPPGFQLANGICVPIDLCSNMPGNQSAVPVNCHQSGTQCLADSGYRVQGAQCVPVGVISNFSATPDRVRENEFVSLNWTILNMLSCNISSSDGTNVAVSHTDGSHVRSGVKVTQVTTYTLSCFDGDTDHSQTVLVNIIPAFEEI